MRLPKMMHVKQHFDAPMLDNIPETVRSEVAKQNLNGKLKKGDSVAISVGSRGIANIALITKTMIHELQLLGAKPFVVPAMGSHGGGTAEGQRRIIESYGVTEQYIGVPIRATMEVEQVGETDEGVPVFFDKYALEADHVVVSGRVKPHTDFTGEIESGLHKMMLIGLGKHKGAALYHQAFVHYSFDRIVRSVGQMVIDKCGVLFGLGIVENQYDKTALIRTVEPENFVEGEKELLLLAKKWMPTLPFKQIDVLLVEEMGKNISGSGMDTNVIGRKYYDHHAAEQEYPKVTRLAVRSLTKETHGNAAGIGIADYTHQRVVDGLDYEATRINTMTGNHPSAGAIPIHFDTDRKMIEAALSTCGLVDAPDARVVRIKSTLEVEEILVSEVFDKDVARRGELSMVAPPKEMEFDSNDNLLPFD